MRKILIVSFLLSLICFSGMSQEILSLKQCKSLALEYNHKLKKADELIRQYESTQKYVKTMFLPKLSFNASYNYLHDLQEINIPSAFLPTAASPADVSTGKFNGVAYFPGKNIDLGSPSFFRGSLELIQPIYTGGKIKSSYKMSQLGGDISVLNKVLTESDVILETEKAYWQLVSVKEKLKMADSYVKMLKSLVRDIQNALDLELKTRNELLKAKVQLNKAELSLFKASNGLALSKMALCQVIGKALNTNIDAEDQIVNSAEVVGLDFLAKAMTNRPELLILQKKIEIGKQKKKIVNSSYMPQIGIGASYSYTSSIIDALGSQKGLMVQAKLSVPVFHWFERKHKLAAQESICMQDEYDFAQAKDMIGLQVSQSYYKFRESFEQIKLADLSMEQAKENLDISKNTFFEGLTSTRELLIAQAMWQQSYSELIDAKINCKLSELYFSKAKGELKK